MCVVTAGVGATAAAASAATATNIGLAISAISTVASIAQAQQAAQMQAAQARTQMEMQTRQRAESARLANQQALTQQQGQARQEKASKLAYYKNLDNINQAVNKTYVQEQAKREDARVKAAFKSQAILAKSIGTQGKILASGATGQSVGLLALDADRQAGFAQAQQNASVESADIQSSITQDIAFAQAQSSANQAFSRTSAPTQAPILDPYGIAGLEIPSYA